MCFYFRNFLCDKPPVFGDIMSHHSAVRLCMAFKAPNLSDVYTMLKEGDVIILKSSSGKKERVMRTSSMSLSLPVVNLLDKVQLISQLISLPPVAFLGL